MNSFKLCRFRTGQGDIRIGLLDASGDAVVDLSPSGLRSLEAILEAPEPSLALEKALTNSLDRLPLHEVKLCPPIEQQEVWAAGVTYLRSKTARMAESGFGATAYDRVYVAERPELFFKALPEKVCGPGEDVGIRRDSNWSVPEPELALVLNSRAELAGYTLGLDMSSRDIEGENLLYLPQAKVYERSCALGPWIQLGTNEENVRAWEITMTISRAGSPVFTGKTRADQIKRAFRELADFLFRSKKFPHGAILLTGTGIVPPDSFTLQPGDVVTSSISGIGQMENAVVTV